MTAHGDEQVCETGWELRARTAHGVPPGGVLATEDAIREYEALRREHNPRSVLEELCATQLGRALDDELAHADRQGRLITERARGNPLVKR